jgi:hypothetical protein
MTVPICNIVNAGIRNQRKNAPGRRIASVDRPQHRTIAAMCGMESQPPFHRMFKGLQERHLRAISEISELAGDKVGRPDDMSGIESGMRRIRGNTRS